MRRRPHRICSTLERTSRDIALAMELVPFVDEHSHRGGARLPVGGEGGGSQLIYSDATFAGVATRYNMGQESAWSPERSIEGEQPMQVVDTPGGRFAVLEPRDFSGGPHEEDHGTRALRAVEERAEELQAAVLYLVKQAPEAAKAVRAGWPLSADGTFRDHSAIEAETKQWQPARDETCRVCGEPVSKPRLHMDERHYFQWYRSKERATGGDLASWVVRAHYRWLIEELVAMGAQAADLAGTRTEELEEMVAGKRRLPRPRRHLKVVPEA